ncbi:calcium/sodium antiporter [Patescibacteria group bacterium]|nr:calcium/sodium antiporter [Patescibacteria group bacterium]
MFVTSALFGIGFVLLIKGADYLVSGASSLAARLGVSALVIGLTIVAFGTSAPELIVNILASLNGNTDIAIGNILGSNIVNILIILGVSAILCPLTVGRGTVWKEIPFALLAVVVLGFLSLDIIIDGTVSSVITRSEGLVLISFFVIFLYYIFGLARADAQASEESVLPEEKLSYGRAILFIILGLVGLVVGGKWIVDGAIMFATMLGVSEALIGLTVVAIGTSLPELATSVTAALKKESDIAVGNVIGSNIFNIFWILGLSATLAPLSFSSALIFDLGVTFGVTLFLFIALFVGRRYTIERWQGALFVVLYVFYVAYLIWRG